MIEVPGARVSVKQDGEIFTLFGLEVDEDAPPETLLVLLRKANEFSKGKTVRCAVDMDEDFERLTKVYMNFGMKPIAVLMERQCQE